VLAGGVHVNARFPAGSCTPHGTAICTSPSYWVTKGADLRALDREHETTPAHWARVALKAFNRKHGEAVAEYLEGLMSV
jgi:hypothetical protein